jgi:hypothetical protein
MGVDDEVARRGGGIPPFAMTQDRGRTPLEVWGKVAEEQVLKVERSLF